MIVRLNNKKPTYRQNNISENLKISKAVNIEIVSVDEMRWIGHDPQLHLGEICYSDFEDGNLVLEIKIYLFQKSECELFFGNIDDEFSQSQCIHRNVDKGQHSLKYNLKPLGLPFKLRFDPHTKPGACVIRSMRVYESESVRKTGIYDIVLRKACKTIWSAFQIVSSAMPFRNRRYSLIPFAQMKQESSGAYLVEGPDPQFHCLERPLYGLFSYLFINITIHNPSILKLYWSENGVFSEIHSRSIPVTTGLNKIVLRNPISPLSKYIRLDPCENKNKIDSIHLSISNSLLRFARSIGSSLRAFFLLQMHYCIRSIRSHMRLLYAGAPRDYQVSVIIPVYGQLHYLIPCIQTVLRNTKPGVEIIIIDDASPGNEISDFLATIKDSRVRIITNEKNLGFVGSVNKGMQTANGHVILLNSDTEVPPGWVDRLLQLWSSNPCIGTITPFSNNATICSFPQFNQDNDLYLDLSLQEIDAVFQKNSVSHLYALPTAVGFCMFISRPCLIATGFFDEKTFGKGYGEENDFCIRAERRGFISALCPNLFVYHKGNVSFGINAKPNLLHNYNLLIRKWPFYPNYVKSFLQKDPFADLRFSSALALVLKRESTICNISIFHVVSGELQGGTLKNVNDIVQNTPHDISAFLLKIYPNRIDLYKRSFSKPIGSFPYLLAHIKCIVAAVRKSAINPYFHIHHLINCSPEWMQHISSSGVPYYFTIHDYYAACPSYTLINLSGQFCNAERNPVKCQTCNALNKFSTNRKVLITSWRKQWSQFLQNAKKVFFPSHTSYQIIRRYYNLDNGFVLPHSRDNLGYNNTSVSTNTHNETRRLLTVAVIGAIGYQKGSRIVLNIAKECFRRRLPIRFIVIGYLDILPTSCVELGGYLTVTGPYEGNQLLEHKRKYNPDIAFLPSIWPETFSYTLSEAWSLHLPVLAYDLGAIAERINSKGNGWTIPLVNPHQAVKVTIDKLLELFSELRQPSTCTQTGFPAITSPEELAYGYYETYTMSHFGNTK